MLDAIGVLNLETGVPEKTQAALAALGWPLKPNPGVYGGYQAIERWPGRYAAAPQDRINAMEPGAPSRVSPAPWPTEPA